MFLQLSIDIQALYCFDKSVDDGRQRVSLRNYQSDRVGCYRRDQRYRVRTRPLPQQVQEARRYDSEPLPGTNMREKGNGAVGIDHSPWDDAHALEYLI